MATPLGLGMTSLSQPAGIIRSLTAEFLRARASARRSRDQSDVSDSEDVRWVSLGGGTAVEATTDVVR